MLELRPICEHCMCDLPADSDEARICSYECTFCRSCVESVLLNVCPNCGGGFVPRPVRPAIDRRSGVSLHHQPATTQRKHRPVDEKAHREFAASVSVIAPARR
jgi:hypothetical protein